MLGRLAKGVGGLAKGVAGKALGEARAALTAVPNDEAEVEGLLQRISDSLLPEYRRQAMSQLKDLLYENPKAQLAFGSMGLPVLLGVLRDDRDDLALLAGALEALLAATATPASVAAAAAAGQQLPPGVTAAEAQAASLTADLLSRHRDHVGVLLGLLEEEPVGVPDFYVRYHTVQLLTQLLNHCPARLQDAILATPMSVVRLTELLRERSEVIRNEALLLLAALTRSETPHPPHPQHPGAGPQQQQQQPGGVQQHAGGGAAGPGAGGGGGSSEVQKIAAFEGAFDRVAELLREEGGLDGGMVVQDCLELMRNLLRGNLANQRLFREMGHAAALPQLLAAALPAASTAAAGGGGGSGGRPRDGADGDGLFAPAAGPIPFLSSGAHGDEDAFGGGGGGGGGGAHGEGSLELHHALAALAAAGSEALRGPPALGAQKEANVMGLLEAMRLLCAPPTSPSDPDRAAELSNRSANQAKLLAAGSLEALAAAGLAEGGLPSPPVRAAALAALGDLVAELPQAQERLGRATVRAAAAVDGAAAAAPEVAGEVDVVPVLQAVLRVALYGSDAAERVAAEHVIACYCRGNAEGQAGLAASIGVGGGGVAAGVTRGSSSSSFGQELVAGLQALNANGGSNEGVLVTCRAARVLQHILYGNAAVRHRLLTVPLEAPAAPGVPPDYLMPRLVRLLAAALRPPLTGEPARLLLCTLLRLLLVWLHDCPPAVAALLDGAAHIPLLLDLATGRQGTTQGHAPPQPLLPPYGGPAPAAPHGGSAAAAAASGGSSGDPIVCGLAACLLAACILYGKPPPSSPPGAPSPSDMVLDVVLSRVGLSHFFFRLDDLRRSPAFAAAAAAAATTTALPYSAAKLLSRTAPAAADQQATAAASDASAELSFHLGRDVVGLVSELEEAVRQRTMDVFSRPAGHRGQDSLPSSASEVPGADDASRLAWALGQLGRLGREAEELRARNRALAEDVFRLSQGLGAAPPPPPPSSTSPAAAAPPPHAAHQPGAAGALGGGLHGAQPGSCLPGGGSSAADVEVRVALELRAGRAEQEAAMLRQQLELQAARLSQAEADAAAAREAAAAAHLAASKAEADLRDLSAAYNNLETHAYAAEAQLRAAQTAAQQAQAAAAAAEVRAQQAEMRAAGAGRAGPSEADIQRRIDEAVAEARAQAEDDDGMTDLLVCLGQEERKVQLLSSVLAERGVDVEELLATIPENDPEADQDAEELR